MLENLFRSGTLELPVLPPAEVLTEARWSDYTVNRVLVVLTLAIFLVLFKEIARLFPKLLDCAYRGSYNQQMERNLSEKRSRDFVAFSAILPLSVILDRFDIYRYGLFEGLPPGWSTAAYAGLLLFWLLLHTVALLCFGNSAKGRYEMLAAAHHIIYSFSVLLVSVLLASIGILMVFSASDAVVSTVLRWEFIAVYAFSCWRFVRFLKIYCSAFSTFLYLCTLEFLPAGIILVGGML